MAEFAYNKTKNLSTGYKLFELNYGCYFCIFYKKDFNLYSKLITVEKLFPNVSN